MILKWTLFALSRHSSVLFLFSFLRNSFQKSRDASVRFFAKRRYSSASHIQFNIAK